MRVYEIALKRRSIRRFKKRRIPFPILQKLVNAARFAPSAANLQPCEFVIVDEPKTVEQIFPNLKWAGYIHPAGNPPQGEEPVAYIVVLNNSEKKSSYAEADAAACIESMILIAQDEGLGSCWLGAIDRDKIREVLKIPQYCEVKYVLALGYPNELPKAEKMADSVKYWKDKTGRLHVPKRTLKQVMHRNFY